MEEAFVFRITKPLYPVDLVTLFCIGAICHVDLPHIASGIFKGRPFEVSQREKEHDRSFYEYEPVGRRKIIARVI